MNTNTSLSSRLAGWFARNLDGLVLVLILLAVGGFAGAASFTHVHDWTMDNSPDATGDWFGWANAVISELVPVASLLVMRRRRSRGQSVAYPAFLLVVTLALSITAQLAVAEPGFTGGLVSVIPALAFAALAKLIIGMPANEHSERAEPTAQQDFPTPDQVMLGELVPTQHVSSPNGHRDTAGLIGTVTR